MDDGAFAHRNSVSSAKMVDSAVRIGDKMGLTDDVKAMEAAANAPVYGEERLRDLFRTEAIAAFMSRLADVVDTIEFVSDDKPTRNKPK